MRRSLAARALPGVERVDERGYARTVATDGGHTIACVRPLDGVDALELSLRGAPPAALFLLSSAARRAFDLAADPARISLAFQTDPLLGPLVRLRPGVRIVAAWDPFEGAVRALLDPSELARLVARAGRPIDGGGDGLTHLFPSSEALASVGGRVGALARAVADGRIDLGAPVEDVGAALAALPGLDPRTLQDILLRALGDPDAFPAGDPALRRVAAGGSTPISARALAARADSWRPWRGYAAFHLWSAAPGAHVRKRPLLARRRA
jgi:3-methyladenine DNA glycosylase/8-oxoguanine DNA glycosylase